MPKIPIFVFHSIYLHFIKIFKYYFIILKFALQYMKSMEFLLDIYEVAQTFAGVVDS